MKEMSERDAEFLSKIKELVISVSEDKFKGMVIMATETDDGKGVGVAIFCRNPKTETMMVMAKVAKNELFERLKNCLGDDNDLGLGGD